ncbi:MAG: hypothetical protein M1832_006392 [Thelocarpon impressellum]|nr:MAG: hypothetical protein M1832_006392 [Thelocarpon impressellum]
MDRVAPADAAAARRSQTPPLTSLISSAEAPMGPPPSPRRGRGAYKYSCDNRALGCPNFNWASAATCPTCTAAGWVDVSAREVARGRRFPPFREVETRWVPWDEAWGDKGKTEEAATASTVAQASTATTATTATASSGRSRRARRSRGGRSEGGAAPSVESDATRARLSATHGSDAQVYSVDKTLPHSAPGLHSTPVLLDSAHSLSGLHSTLLNSAPGQHSSTDLHSTLLNSAPRPLDVTALDAPGAFGGFGPSAPTFDAGLPESATCDAGLPADSPYDATLAPPYDNVHDHGASKYPSMVASPHDAVQDHFFAWAPPHGFDVAGEVTFPRESLALDQGEGVYGVGQDEGVYSVGQGEGVYGVGQGLGAVSGALSAAYLTAGPAMGMAALGHIPPYDALPPGFIIPDEQCRRYTLTPVSHGDSHGFAITPLHATDPLDPIPLYDPAQNLDAPRSPGGFQRAYLAAMGNAIMPRSPRPGHGAVYGAVSGDGGAVGGGSGSGSGSGERDAARPGFGFM